MANKLQKGIAYYKKHGFAATLEHIFADDYAMFSKLPPERYEEALKKWYKRKTGEDLDLENPKTYNEKIQWLKLYDSTPLKTRLADKYLVRDWVKEKIGEEYLIPLLGVWDDFDEIDFSRLPNQFVLKANHGCSWNIIVKDKSQLDIADARKKFKKWMSRNFAFQCGLELQYLNIPPKIIAEAYISEAGQTNDYKFMCFDGCVRLAVVNTGRFVNHEATFYSTDWRRLDRTMAYPPSKNPIPAPENLSEMLRLAAELGEGMNHVRADFYNVHGRVYFGEMTFTTGSGILSMTPPEFDRELGDLLRLPAEKSPIPTRN